MWLCRMVCSRCGSTLISAAIRPETRAGQFSSASRIVLPAIYFGPGVAVWLFARDSVHIGASGLVYGLVSYVFVAGLMRRDRRAIAASLLVVFVYGSLVWGVLPIQPHMSWEMHLSAAVIGVLLALAFRKLDVPPRKRYAWEEEATADDDNDEERPVAEGGGGTLPGAVTERRDRASSAPSA